MRERFAHEHLLKRRFSHTLLQVNLQNVAELDFALMLGWEELALPRDQTGHHGDERDAVADRPHIGLDIFGIRHIRGGARLVIG